MCQEVKELIAQARLEDAFNDAMIVVETEHPSAAGIIEVWKDGQQSNL